MSRQHSHNRITDHRSETHSMPHSKRKRVRYKANVQTPPIQDLKNKTLSWKCSFNIAMIIAGYLIFGHLEGDISIKLLTLAMIIISHMHIALEGTDEN